MNEPTREELANLFAEKYADSLYRDRNSTEWNKCKIDFLAGMDVQRKIIEGGGK